MKSIVNLLKRSAAAMLMAIVIAMAAGSSAMIATGASKSVAQGVETKIESLSEALTHTTFSEAAAKSEKKSASKKYQEKQHGEPSYVKALKAEIKKWNKMTPQDGKATKASSKDKKASGK